MSANKPWDMGHLPSYENRKLQDYAAAHNWTRDQYLDAYNNPDSYAPELPSSNRGHSGEDPTGTFLGP